MKEKSRKKSKTNFDINKATEIFKAETNFLSNLFNSIPGLSTGTNSKGIKTKDTKLNVRKQDVREDSASTSQEEDADESDQGPDVTEVVKNRKEEDADKSDQGSDVKEVVKNRKGRISRSSKQAMRKILNGKQSRKERKNKLILSTIQKDIKVPEEKKVSQKSVKPVINSDGSLVFNRFDFSIAGTMIEDKISKGPQDPRGMLKTVMKQQDKLLALKKEGKNNKADNLKEKLAWESAFKKTEGLKVKDDVNLLKKSIRKLNERKKKSKKKWEGIQNDVQKRKEAKQKRRNQNIENRKKQVKLNKLKKSIKKGRIIPGFS